MRSPLRCASGWSSGAPLGFFGRLAIVRAGPGGGPACLTEKTLPGVGVTSGGEGLSAAVLQASHVLTKFGLIVFSQLRLLPLL